VQAGRVDATRYLALVENLGAETDRTIWDHVTGFPALSERLDRFARRQAVFDRYVVRLLDTPFASVGWDARPGEPADAALVRRSLIEALGRAGHEAVVREAQSRFAARAHKPIDPAIRPAVLNVVGRYADEATFEALLQRMRSAIDMTDKWEAQAALRQVRDPSLLRRLMGLMLTDELPPATRFSISLTSAMTTGVSSLAGSSCWNTFRHPGQGVAGWTPSRSARRRLGFNDAARADELIALTRLHLDAPPCIRRRKPPTGSA